MQVAYTAPSELGTSHDTVAVVNQEATPRKDELVEVDDSIYRVTAVEWHINTTSEGDADDAVDELAEVIVRLVKIGEA